MKIGLGAKVVASGGEAIGTVDRLIIEPEKRTLVGLIVHRGRFLTEDRIIERDLIDDVGVNGSVRLSVTAHEAEALPQFVKAEFVTPNEGMDAVLYPPSGSGFLESGAFVPGLSVSDSFSSATPTFGASGPHSGGVSSAPGGLVGTSQYDSLNFEMRSNLPSEVLVIEHNAEVVDSNGRKVGHIEEIVEDDSGAITGLRVRSGMFGRKHGYVPAESIAGASPKRVRLSIPVEAVVQADPAEETRHPQVVALVFEDVGGANGMMENVANWENRGLLALDDAIVVTVPPSGRAELQQMRGRVGKATGRGAGLGILAGLLLGGPVAGLAAGAAIGAIAGALRDTGLDDEFVRGISSSLCPDTSALFLLVRDADSARILDELRPHKAQVSYTTLPDEQERLLRRALASEE